MQKFEVTVPIQLPENLMIIEVDIYKKLKKGCEIGRWWSMDDVLSHISISRKTFTDKILSNSKFKKELEQFIHYPTTKGEKYYFLASKTTDFLENRFPEIMKEL